MQWKKDSEHDVALCDVNQEKMEILKLISLFCSLQKKALR